MACCQFWVEQQLRVVEQQLWVVEQLQLEVAQPVLEVAQLALHESALGQPLAAETWLRSEETQWAPAAQGAGPGSAPFPLLVRVLAPSLFTFRRFCRCSQLLT